MSLRLKGKLLYAGLRFGVGFLLLLISPATHPGIALAGLLVMLAGHLPAALLTELILVNTVDTITCPGCGFEMEAVGRWTVGGFTPPRESHVLRAKSALDGSCVGHVECPHCDTTILVR